jgi:hypothetical protein
LSGKRYFKGKKQWALMQVRAGGSSGNGKWEQCPHLLFSPLLLSLVSILHFVAILIFKNATVILSFHTLKTNSVFPSLSMENTTLTMSPSIYRLQFLLNFQPYPLFILALGILIACFKPLHMLTSFGIEATCSHNKFPSFYLTPHNCVMSQLTLVPLSPDLSIL